jgi:predicted transcriptional regulator
VAFTLRVAANLEDGCISEHPRLSIYHLAWYGVTKARAVGETHNNPACWYACSMKVTIDLDPELYRAVKVEAARADRSVREIVDEALAAWLERLEEAEDTAAAAEALAEYERDGGVAADTFFRAHAAETQAAYGSSGEG